MGHRSKIAALVTAAVLAVAALAGCGAGDESPPSGGSSGPPSVAASPSSPAASPTPTPTPAELTEARAARAFAAVEVPAGLRTDIQCPPRTAEDRQLCSSDDTAVAWTVVRTYLGRDLPQANGATEAVTLNLTTATSEQRADALYRQRTAALQRYDGAYDVPIAREAGRYTPGERGRGTRTPATAGAWTGVDLSQEFVMVFDTSTSGRLASGRRVLRRGLHVLDVAWTAADGKRAADLADLPDRVVTALDRPG